MEQQSFSLIPPELAVQAMRDSGYKNAAYAIAELMDNSIQAGADSVELLCEESEVDVGQRTRRRIKRIAVLDNGSGMSPEVLRMALQFGNGTHIDDRSGIGRFGMGLPSASISQCKRVDVWTWTDGIPNAVHSYVDVDEVNEGKMVEVPAPQPSPVPSTWKEAGEVFGESGTLVVWSSIDRCSWKTARAIIRNSEFIIGRMYRRFLDLKLVRIRMGSFLEGRPQDATDEQAVANDPMYLMSPSSTPHPYDMKPMFRGWGETPFEVPVTIAFRGQDHVVKLRFAYASEEAREGHAPGDRPYGKHAAKNVGVSIMRADRELELEQGWVVAYDPRERWWGVEIDFMPGLDEVFGVTNNKQAARHLADVARLDIDALRGDRSVQELKEELLDDGDPLGALLEISDIIGSNLRQIRQLLHAQTRGTRGRRRHDPTSPEARATEATRERQDAGRLGASDAEEGRPESERRTEIRDGLIGDGLSAGEADEITAAVVDFGLKYQFTETPMESAAFFSVRPRAGTLFVNINTKHPAHRHLLEVLEDVDESEEPDGLRTRLGNALDGLKLLLAAWARFEDETQEERQREQLQDVRNDWGRVARQFLRDDS